MVLLCCTFNFWHWRTQSSWLQKSGLSGQGHKECLFMEKWLVRPELWLLVFLGMNLSNVYESTIIANMNTITPGLNQMRNMLDNLNGKTRIMTKVCYQKAWLCTFKESCSTIFPLSCFAVIFVVVWSQLPLAPLLFCVNLSNLFLHTEKWHTFWKNSTTTWLSVINRE